MAGKYPRNHYLEEYFIIHVCYVSGIGLIFCILRIFFCVCPSHCISRDRNKKNAKVDADHRTSLLRDTKRVSIARGPYINVNYAKILSSALI